MVTVYEIITHVALKSQLAQLRSTLPPSPVWFGHMMGSLSVHSCCTGSSMCYSVQIYAVSCPGEWFSYLLARN